MKVLKIFKDSYRVPTSNFILFSRLDRSILFMCSSYIGPSLLIISVVCSECVSVDCLQQVGDDCNYDVMQFATISLYKTNSQIRLNSLNLAIDLGSIQSSFLYQPLKLVRKKKERKRMKKEMEEYYQISLSCVQIIFQLWAKELLKKQSIAQFSNEIIFSSVNLTK